MIHFEFYLFRIDKKENVKEKNRRNIYHIMVYVIQYYPWYFWKEVDKWSRMLVYQTKKKWIN